MNHKNLLLITLLLISVSILAKSKKAKSLKVGDFAPAFSLPDETGTLRNPLSEYKSAKIVLYFYPQDGTQNCTKEACQLRDNYAEYRANQINIFGISYDSVASHAKFKAAQHLPFTLLSDPNHIVAKLYNANQGLLSGFYAQRKTILIDPAGKIVAIIDNVNLKTHAQDILKAFRNT